MNLFHLFYNYMVSAIGIKKKLYGFLKCCIYVLISIYSILHLQNNMSVTKKKNERKKRKGTEKCTKLIFTK